MLSGEVLAKCEEIIAESDEPIATKEMQVAVIKEIDVEQTNEEENVVKQVTSHEEMEFKLDEVFNKLQKKVMEDLVAKLKLQERKISLLSKHPCDASQYKASSNFTLNEREKNPCVERKYKARLTFTCDYCQFSANSARFLQIHKENSHNKREVNVHGGADYEEVLNECGKSRLKLENKSVLSKHIQSKHQGTDSDEALNDCVKGQLKLENESVPSKHIRSVHQDRKYTCDFCQFSANSAKGLQIHEVNSHNKCEVAMHREAEHAEAPNECVKDNLKSKNESALRKHMQSKHQAFVKKLGLGRIVW